jgi:hypothetical protein
LCGAQCCNRMATLEMVKTKTATKAAAKAPKAPRAPSKGPKAQKALKAPKGGAGSSPSPTAGGGRRQQRRRASTPPPASSQTGNSEEALFTRFVHAYQRGEAYAHRTLTAAQARQEAAALWTTKAQAERLRAAAEEDED